MASERVVLHDHLPESVRAHIAEKQALREQILAGQQTGDDTTPAASDDRHNAPPVTPPADERHATSLVAPSEAEGTGGVDFTDPVGLGGLPSSDGDDRHADDDASSTVDSASGASDPYDFNMGGQHKYIDWDLG